MNLDDELCLCFHVSKRKVLNFLRIERPKRASQLSQCFGAGTGCGWCRTYMQHLFEQYQAGTLPTAASLEAGDVAASDYAKQRAEYVRAGGGTPPPGATPIE